MKNHWHEQIQRYLSGQASAEEVAALQAKLNEDPELRALYLDYMNLDMALAAAAEAAPITENGLGVTRAFRQPPAWRSPHYWRWLAATAAGAALVVFALLSRPRNSWGKASEVAAAIRSTQHAIARLTVEPPSAFPAWASPTASMLEPPRIYQ